MSILLILLIIAVAIAPLLSALPTESQRYEAKVRANAINQGVIIKLESLPDIPARYRLPSKLSLIAYRLRRSKRDPRFEQPQLAVRTEGDWLSVPEEKVLRGGLLLLPDGAYIAELGVDYVSVFWDEKGDLEAVDKVANALVTLIDLQSFE